jgi:hypothetical protein
MESTVTYDKGCSVTDDERPVRLTLLHFHNGELVFLLLDVPCLFNEK